MWKPLLVLGCTFVLAACATNPDPLAKIGKEKRAMTAACMPQVGSRLLRHGRCLKHNVRVYSTDGNDALGAWWLDPAVSFGH